MVSDRFSASGAYKSALEPAEKLFNVGRCPGRLEGKSLLLHHKQLSTFILKRNTYFCTCQRLGKSSPDSNRLGTKMHNSAATLILTLLKELLFVEFVSCVRYFEMKYLAKYPRSYSRSSVFWQKV